jgi:hypothetical protein
MGTKFFMSPKSEGLPCQVNRKEWFPGLWKSSRANAEKLKAWHFQW